MPKFQTPVTASQAPISVTQVWLMGGWRILHHGLPIEIPSGQPRTLLAYLLLQPEHAALRSTLIEELWPDGATERGRRHLSDALYRLRRALDPALILADAERIALNMEHAWWVDVWAFYEATASPDPEQRNASLELYSQTLVPEITEHWILVQRIRLQECFVQTALEVAAEAETIHDSTRAEAVYRQTLTVDPLLEAAHRGIMRNLAHSGHLAAALEHYDALVDRLERDVAAPPSPATRALADQLFQELDLARRRAETRTVRRIVGRVEERTWLLTALDNARAGHAKLVVLLGEPGIGKTALLRDLAHAADWRGWQIHWGFGQDGISPAPYAPLTEALDAALPLPRAAQLAADLPPIWNDLLARLFPTLQRSSVLPAAAFDSKRLPQAIAQLLYALQEIAPLLLLLDDVQWGDSALWQLLHEVVPLLHQQRVLLVVSGRRDDLRADTEIWTQLETWDREGVAQIIALEGLSSVSLKELVTLHQQQNQTQGVEENFSPPISEQVEALHTTSGGNPLLALEILTAGTPQALLTSHPAIATLVTQRLQRLSLPTRQAAGLAAILGSQVSYHHWQTLWQQENPYGSELTSHAAELERFEVLQIGRNGYSFVHDTLHAAALADMDAFTRSRRHRAALALLSAPEQSPPANPLRLLYHAQGAEAHNAIVCYALQAGEQALRVFSFARAETHFTLALKHIALSNPRYVPEGAINNTGNFTENATEANSDPRYEALLGRIQARHVLAMREGEIADLEEIRTLACTPVQQATVLLRLAQYQLAVAEIEVAQSTIEEALALAETLEATQAADLHLIAARILRDLNHLDAAQEHVATAQLLYRNADNHWGVAMTTDLLGGLAWDQGGYERATTLHEQAADAFQLLGDLVHEAQSLNNLGSTYWELGRYADARSVHERSILVCRELGNKLGEGDNIDNLGGVAWVLGNYTLAIRQYRSALELRESIDDKWGVAISLSNLASAYRMQGAYEQALDYYHQSLLLYQLGGRKRSEAYVMHGEGEALLKLGRLDEAWARLQEALALRIEIGDRIRLLETYAALIRAALARNDLPQATAYCETMVSLLVPTDRASLRQEVYYAAFCLDDYLSNYSDDRERSDSEKAKGKNREKAARSLALALAAQTEMAAVLPQADQARFLQNVPLNRELTQAAQRYTQTEAVTLGQGNQNKVVTWTLVAPEDLGIEDATARRRHVLTRLLAQAAAHEVTPTHDQLATALAVSRRTILRDIAALQQQDPAT